MKALLLSLALLLPNLGFAQEAPIVLNTSNTVLFRGPVTGASVTKAQLNLVEAVKTRGSGKYPIYLVLDSPGGSIYAGEAFIAFARTLPNVETISIFAASMAAGIVESMPGKRHITPGGILMFHRASGGFEGQFEEGEVESQLALWKQIVRTMEGRNASRIGISLEAYKAKVVNEWWLYGADAVTQKGADKISTIVCSQALIDKREVVVSQMFIFTVKSVYSGCPLFRGPLPDATEEEEEED